MRAAAGSRTERESSVLEDGNDSGNSAALDEASRVVAHHLDQCRLLADYYLTRTWRHRPPGESVDHDYFSIARDMMRLHAELASTLARLKGEHRQRIVVEHIEAPAPPALIGEARAVPLSPVSGEGGVPESGKRVVAVEATDAATS